MADNVSNGRRGPLVELGALHRLLDKLKPDDLESMSSWYSSSEPCCKEIVDRFRNLLDKWASDQTKVQQSLANDCNLTKCEHCGVIKCLESSEVQEDVNEKKGDVETIPEPKQNTTLNPPSIRPVARFTRKQEIMRNSHPIFPCRNRTDLPSSDKSTMGHNHRNVIPKKLPAKVPRPKITSRSVEKNSTALSEVVGKSLEKEFPKCDDDKAKNHRLVENLEYLVQENVEKNSTTLSEVVGKSLERKCHKWDDGKAKNHLVETLEYLIQENVGNKKDGVRGKRSFDVHGSRDMNIDERLGFVVYDRLRPQNELQERSWIMGNERAAKIEGFNGSMGDDSFSQLNENSSNVPFHESDFSSSSAENLIRQWIKPSWDDHHVNAEKKGHSGTKASLMNDLPPEPKDLLPRMKNLPPELRVSLSGPRNSPPELKDSSLKVLLNYRKILESSEEMDWPSFEKLVTALHPSHRELWREICRAVSNEAKRLAEETGATTEVCIELNPLPGKKRDDNDEISFELDLVT